MGDIIHMINNEKVVDMNQAQARNLVRHHSLLSRNVNMEYITRSDAEKLRREARRKRHGDKGVIASRISSQMGLESLKSASTMHNVSNGATPLASNGSIGDSIYFHLFWVKVC